VYAAIAVLILSCILLTLSIGGVLLLRAGSPKPPSKTKDWELVDTGFCTFRFPPTMELRRGTTTKAIAAVIRAQSGIEAAPEFVVQPKGMDAFAAG
jgi:hypothetical protein